MRHRWIVAFALLFVAAAGFAETSAPAQLGGEALAAILDQSAAGASCPTRAGEVVFASESVQSTCNATANCGSTTVSCTGTSSCSAVDRNCSTLTRGSVTCDGVTTSCPTSCCTGGTIQQNFCCRCNATGTCMDCCRCAGGSLSQCYAECNGG